MKDGFRNIIEFLFICIPLIALVVLVATSSYSTRTTINTEKVTSVKEHLITGDVYVVCLNGVKYYYIEDGISKLGLAPVYNINGNIMLCNR